jgi:hypothetical protein
MGGGCAAMVKAFNSAVVALLIAAGAALGVAGLGGFPPEDMIHWRDALEDHNSFTHCADLVFALVLAAVSYWRGLAGG